MTRFFEVVALTAALGGPQLVAGADSGSHDEREVNLAPKVVRKAQRLALRQLSRHSACQALFKDLGHSGRRLVADATFRLASPTEGRRICRRRKGALFTTVGGRKITLCLNAFVLQPTRTQAALLLHEALHHAGVSEQPEDPQGLTSLEITELVERKCKL